MIYKIFDVGSKHGTFVDNQKVQIMKSDPCKHSLDDKTSVRIDSNRISYGHKHCCRNDSSIVNIKTVNINSSSDLIVSNELNCSSYVKGSKSLEDGEEDAFNDVKSEPLGTNFC